MDQNLIKTAEESFNTIELQYHSKNNLTVISHFLQLHNHVCAQHNSWNELSDLHSMWTTEANKVLHKLGKICIAINNCI